MGERPQGCAETPYSACRDSGRRTPQRIKAQYSTITLLAPEETFANNLLHIGANMQTWVDRFHNDKMMLEHSFWPRLI